MLQRSISHRIYSDPAYTELVKLITFKGMPYPLSVEATEALNAKYGKDKMMKAAEDLITYDTTERRAKLKDDIRPLCRQLLGPMPEEWDEFYANVERPPPNPYAPPLNIHRLRQDVDVAKDESPEIIDDESKVNSPIPQRMVPPPELTAEEMLRRLDDAALQELLADAKWGVEHHGSKSRQGRQLQRDVAMAEAESTRRGLRSKTVQEPSEVELIRSMHGRKLRGLLLSQHILIRNHQSVDPIHDESLRRIDILETEMRRRGQKVPQRPPVTLVGIEARKERIRNLEGIDLMQRYFTAKRILESESEHTGVFQQTQIEFDLLETECRNRDFALPPSNRNKRAVDGADGPEMDLFRRETKKRLTERLDVCRYEVAHYGPETVTHQEAARGAFLIAKELQQRKNRPR